MCTRKCMCEQEFIRFAMLCGMTEQQARARWQQMAGDDTVVKQMDEDGRLQLEVIENLASMSQDVEQQQQQEQS